MTLLIGTDEAGYGPNLGPLVVAATAWRADHAPDAVDGAVAAAAAAAWNAPPDPLWADSKTIYRAGAGFAALERGVHAALLVLHGAAPDAWPRLEALLGPIGPEAGAAVEGPTLEALELPRAADPAECRRRAAAAAAALDGAGLALVGSACRAIHPGDFNRLLDAGLNKSDILSRTTLDLAAALLGRHGPDEAVVWCDRHGGRKRYAALVARHFAAPLVQPLEETQARSAYLAPAARLRVEFSVGGEARLPVALASMAAKYVRELAMEAFNAFWCDRVPGLAATAGYPVDARRWRAAAAPAIHAAGLPLEEVWRRA